MNQLREHVGVVAAPSQVQLAWSFKGRSHLPVDEIAQSLEQVVWTHRPRIKEAGLITEEANQRIEDLIAYFEVMRALDKWILWQDEGLDEPEWDVARSKARSVLEVL